MKKTPLTLTGIILEILKNWFNSNSEKFKFTSDPATSRITIEPEYDFNPDDCQNRPGIYVTRGDLHPRGGGRIGIDDLYSIHSAGTSHGVMSVCQMECNAIGKLPGEISALAEEAYLVLVQLSPLIKRDFNFKQFNVEVIKKITKYKESTEFFIISIIISTAFSDVWPIISKEPLIKTTIIDAYTKLHAELGKGYSEGNYTGGSYG